MLFCNGLAKDMVVLGFSSKGYAVNQIKEVRDFVINVPDRSMLDAINYCGSHTGLDTDIALKKAHGPLPDPKRSAGSPCAF
jgi:flavin reductase (DIM6/NTAB) family NADH-FMN oxidoreductase RutF